MTIRFRHKKLPLDKTLLTTKIRKNTVVDPTTKLYGVETFFSNRVGELEFKLKEI
jgi:hypothetical protein